MKVGPYDVVKEIGRGGMGVVLRCRSPSGEDVAVKVLQATSRNALPRFERERRLLESLGEAEGFVPLLASGDAPQGPYLVMPFVAGGTLRERLWRGALPIDESVALAKALAAALGRAHARGIVHRDVKPENVLFTEDGRPLIADLGLGKHFRHDTPGASQSVSLSQHGEFRGTAGYMAPEQIHDAKAAGPEADVFSLGAILHECLAGSPAFDGETTIEVLAKIAEGRCAPLQRFRGDVPSWLAAVIRQALDPDRKRRFADGGALLAALEAGKARGRSRAPILLAALFLVATVVAAAALAVSSRREPEPAPVEAPPPPPLPPRTVEPPKTVAPPVERSFPFPCRGFVKSGEGKIALQAVWGSYRSKHADIVHAVAFSPDGTRALSASEDGTLALWDAKTGEETAALLGGHRDGVLCAAFSPDGKRVVSGGKDQRIVLWDVESGKVLRTTPGPTPYWIQTIAFSPDGKRILSSGGEPKVKLWDAETGKLLAALDEHEEWVHGVAFAPGGRYAISGSDDATILRWDLGSPGKSLDPPLKHDAAVLAVAVSPDGGRALAGCKDRTVRLWDLAAAKPLRTLEGHQGDVTAVAFSPDGRRALTGSGDCKAILWDLESGRKIVTLEGHEDAVSSVAFSPSASAGPDGERALTGSHDGTVALWDLASGKALAPPPGHRRAVRSVAFLPDGKQAVTGSADRTVVLWEVAGGKPVWTFAGHKGAVSSVAVSPAGDMAASASDDRTVKVWNLATGNVVRTLGDPEKKTDGHQDAVLCVAFVHGTKRKGSAGLLSGSKDRTLRLWDLETGAAVTPGGSHGWIQALAVSPDGLRAISAGEDTGITLWDISKERLSSIGNDPVLRTLHGHDDAVMSLAFLPSASAGQDGERALSASLDGTCRLWDLSPEGKTLATLAARKGGVLAVAASPDGKRALTASFERTIHLWDLAASREIDRVDLGSSADRALSLAFSPDGNSFAAATARGVVLVFSLK